MNVKVILLLCFLTAIFLTNSAAEIIYVDYDANGVNNGTSWENAYTYLQDALTDAQNSTKPVEIHVAQGIYRPDEGTGQTKGNRDASFNLIKGVSLSGGYAGIGDFEPNNRNIELFKTILSGDLNNNDIDVNDPNDLLNEPTRAENSLHVITSNYTDETAIIDGFTITAGNANSNSNNIGVGGGGMNIFSGTASIFNCTFLRNSSYFGGGIIIRTTNLTLMNCLFIENMAENEGGGIWNRGNPSLTNCTFSENLTKRDGGGLYNYASSDANLINCTFNSNVASSCGGGIYNFYSKPSIKDCTFIGNLSNEGGGIYNDSATFFMDGPKYIYYNPALSDCNFIENMAKNGGGIYNYGCNPILINCTFTKNAARVDGGGIKNDFWSNTTITNCKFNQNKAESNGGGIENFNSNSIITDCMFCNNSANFGGGLFHAYDNITIINCTFNKNGASYGGGIYNISGSSVLTDCVFDKNTADVSGGGIDNCFSNFKLINCTFAGNLSHYGNTIRNSNSTVEFTNCIIWDDMNKMQNSYDSTITISYCDVKGGHANVYDPNGAIIWGEGNFDSDPCFVSPGFWDVNGTPDDKYDDFWVEGDYHLKSQAGRFDPNNQSWILDDATSPCIDAGNPNSPIGYEPFPNGGRINIGAYGGTMEASKSLNDVNYFQQASYPNPEYGSVNVFLDTILSWVSDPNAAIYEVYFGTNAQPPFIQKQYETVFDPSPLEPNTTYYWRIDEINSSLNRVTGNTWMFLTGNQSIHPSHPYPINGETIDVNVKTRLSWFSGLNALTYDVYFGMDFNNVNDASIMNPLGVLVSAEQEPNFYIIPEFLKHDKTYFWRVDEKDNNGIITKGNIWSFITVPKVPVTRD